MEDVWLHVALNGEEFTDVVAIETTPTRPRVATFRKIVKETFAPLFDSVAAAQIRLATDDGTWLKVNDPVPAASPDHAIRVSVQAPGAATASASGAFLPTRIFRRVCAHKQLQCVNANARARLGATDRLVALLTITNLQTA